MKKILIYVNVLIASLLFASCQDFLDVNTDPNNPTTVTPNLILPQAQKYTAELMYNNRFINNLGNMMMYNWSQSDGFAWYPDEFKYLVTTSFYQQIFNTSYSNPLKQYHLLDQLEDPKYDYYKAIGKIMKAYHYQLLVDMYGDVPYSEALGRSLNATPKYDDAATIYADLIAQLTAAIQLIENAGATVVTPTANDDVMYDGNMTNWIRFANSLKVRILTRISDMGNPPVNIQNELDAITGGFITSNAGINPGYLKEANKQNPYWNTFGAGVDGTKTMNNNATCATDYILDYLDATGDPRIDYLYELPEDGHLGVPQGLLDYDTPVPDAFVPEMVSNIGPGVLKAFNMDAIIFTLAEHNFNLAELAQKGFDTDEDAQTYYQAGIVASFVTLGLEAGQAVTYYTQTLENVGWNFSTDKIEAIITQKWIAVNGINAEQSWFDYSRTGYPSGLPISLQATSADRPVRLYYPAGEISSNGANVPAQPDAFTDKIFWAN